MTTETTDTGSKIHPFERRGLGLAPFQVTGVEERRGPLPMPGGGFVGAPGQPMGTCDFCGTGIAECWHIRSADGKRFIVGSDCVRKAGDAALYSAVSREQGRMRKAAEGRRVAATRERLEGDETLRAALAALPTPSKWRTGESALAWADWMMKHAGHAGRIKVARYIDKNIKTEAAP